MTEQGMQNKTKIAAEQFARTELLLGIGNRKRLSDARVAVFGVGGVGGFVVEALARSGIGTLDLIDNDTVCLSNLNRQIIALHSTLGQYKVDAAKARVLDINPAIQVNCFRSFFLPENAGEFPFSEYDYIVDAIDTVTGKIELVLQAQKYNIPIISSMGAGNKLEPSRFEVADIYSTSVCPLAKVMRRELKKRGIKSLKVVYSKEKARKPFDYNENSQEEQGTSRKRVTPGSTAFVPSVAGLIMAGEVIRDLCITDEMASISE